MMKIFGFPFKRMRMMRTIDDLKGHYDNIRECLPFSVISGAEVTAALPNSFSSFWLVLKAFCDLLKERPDGFIMSYKWPLFLRILFKAYQKFLIVFAEYIKDTF